MDVQSLTSRVVFASIFVLTALPVAATEIVLKKTATVEGTVVRLGDVAEIADTDTKTAKRLTALPLMPAPKAGQERHLRVREIQDLLASRGEEVDSLTFRGAVVVKLESSGVVLAAADESAKPISSFRAAWSGQPASAALKAGVDKPAQDLEPKLTPAQINDIRSELDALFRDYLERMSGRKGNWHVAYELTNRNCASLAAARSELKCMGGNSPWDGRQKLVITFATDDGMARVPVYVDARSTQTVVVAIQPIERGSLVTAAHVELQELENIPVATTRRAPATNIESLIGLEAAHTVAAGDVVMTDDVKPQLLIKRGEPISVYARGGGIQVRTLARAKQDGARGDLIAVESLDSKKPFQAVVTGPREALVFVGGSAPVEAAIAGRPFGGSQSR